jgi:hypothetical protein
MTWESTSSCCCPWLCCVLGEDGTRISPSFSVVGLHFLLLLGCAWICGLNLSEMCSLRSPSWCGLALVSCLWCSCSVLFISKAGYFLLGMGIFPALWKWHWVFGYKYSLLHFCCEFQFLEWQRFLYGLQHILIWAIWEFSGTLEPANPFPVTRDALARLASLIDWPDW